MSIRIGESRIGPRVGTVRARRGRLSWLRRAGVLAAATLCCVLSASAAALAQADSKPQDQAQADRNAQKTAAKQASGQSDMLVEAKEMVYDKDKNTVSAVGN